MTDKFELDCLTSNDNLKTLTFQNLEFATGKFLNLNFTSNFELVLQILNLDLSLKPKLKLWDI